jgi:hypothetical protein
MFIMLSKYLVILIITRTCSSLIVDCPYSPTQQDMPLIASSADSPYQVLVVLYLHSSA